MFDNKTTVADILKTLPTLSEREIAPVLGRAINLINTPQVVLPRTAFNVNWLLAVTKELCNESGVGETGLLMEGSYLEAFHRRASEMPEPPARIKTPEEILAEKQAEDDAREQHYLDLAAKDREDGSYSANASRRGEFSDTEREAAAQDRQQQTEDSQAKIEKNRLETVAHRGGSDYKVVFLRDENGSFTVSDTNGNRVKGRYAIHDLHGVERDVKYVFENRVPSFEPNAADALASLKAAGFTKAAVIRWLRDTPTPLAIQVRQMLIDPNNRRGDSPTWSREIDKALTGANG